MSGIFFTNPDMSIIDALTKLTKLFHLDYKDELNFLYKAIKIGKQYIWQ